MNQNSSPQSPMRSSQASDCSKLQPRPASSMYAMPNNVQLVQSDEPPRLVRPLTIDNDGHLEGRSTIEAEDLSTGVKTATARECAMDLIAPTDLLSIHHT